MRSVKPGGKFSAQDCLRAQKYSNAFQSILVALLGGYDAYMERSTESAPPNPPPAKQMGPLNWLGKLLVLLTTLFTFCIALPMAFWIKKQLGGTPPIVFLVIPAVLSGFGFWVACVKLCKWLDIPIERERTV